MGDVFCIDIRCDHDHPSLLLEPGATVPADVEPGTRIFEKVDR